MSTKDVANDITNVAISHVRRAFLSEPHARKRGLRKQRIHGTDGGLLGRRLGRQYYLGLRNSRKRNERTRVVGANGLLGNSVLFQSCIHKTRC